MSAVVADANGENASDCTMIDFNAGGAQVSGSRNLPVGAQIYLLDIRNQLAYFANVVWSKSDRCGLSFVQKYAIGLGLAPNLSFLWKLLLEAQLRQIDRDVAKGVPVGLAFLNVDLTEVHLHYMSQRVSGDIEFEHALLRAKRLLDK